MKEDDQITGWMNVIRPTQKPTVEETLASLRARVDQLEVFLKDPEDGYQENAHRRELRDKQALITAIQAMVKVSNIGSSYDAIKCIEDCEKSLEEICASREK